MAYTEIDSYDFGSSFTPSERLGLINILRSVGVLDLEAADLHDSSGNLIAVKLPSKTLASLPIASSSNIGSIVWTTDGHSGSAGPVISDGSSWKVITLGSAAAAS